MAIEKSVVVGNTSVKMTQNQISYESSSELDHIHTLDTCLHDLICNKNYNVDTTGTRMLFNPASFSETDLFSLLNNDDSMSLQIKILDSVAKVRINPNIAATSILTASNGDEFEVTKQWRGWFYIESIKGWVESHKVIVTKVIKPYDPEHDVDFESDDVFLPDTQYDAAAIIAALEKSSSKLKSTLMVHNHKKGDGSIESTLVSVLLDQFIGSRDTFDAVIEKVGNMPKIPALPNGDITGFSLVSTLDSLTGKFKLVWKKIDFIDIVNVPQQNFAGAEEF